MRSRLLCTLIVFILCAGPALAQPRSAPVDSLGTHLVQDHPGAAIIGLLHGDDTSVHGFGAVDSTDRPPSATTVFEIGSITKTFTGLLLADAVERGEATLSTPAHSLLPDSIDGAAWEAPMTLAHLATHRSGLPRLPSNLRAGAHPNDPYAAYDDSGLFAFLDGYAPSRAPGKQYEYSNLGMGMLGLLLARQADTSYAFLVRQRIAAPLGLSDTRIRLTEAQRDRLAQGYSQAGSPASPWHFDALAGAGALRSTAADMLAYLRAHRTALKGDQASTSSQPLAEPMRRALRPRAASTQDSTRIGLGWHETTRNGHPVVWHNGGTGGFRSFVAFDRRTGHGAVVLVSSAAATTATETGFSLIEHLNEGRE